MITEIIQDQLGIEYENMLIKCVRNIPFLIKNINNPSQRVKLTAVKTSGISIKFIKNFNEEIKLTAVKQNGNSIKYIINPSQVIKLYAVKNLYSSIQYIESPNEEVQLAAINSCFLNFPDENVKFFIDLEIKSSLEKISFQMKMIKINCELFRFIKNPYKKVQVFVLKQKPEFLAKYYEKFSPIIKKTYNYINIPGTIGILDNK